jgi:hypothetical protein
MEHYIALKKERPDTRKNLPIWVEVCHGISRSTLPSERRRLFFFQ